jgi:hypothetical protein
VKGEDLGGKWRSIATASIPVFSLLAEVSSVYREDAEKRAHLDRCSPPSPPLAHSLFLVPFRLSGTREGALPFHRTPNAVPDVLLRSSSCNRRFHRS